VNSLASIDWSAALDFGDWALLSVGTIISCVAFTRWLITSRRDPLAEIGIPPNRLSVEGVLLPMFVWIMVGSILGMLAGAGTGEGKPTEAAMIYIGNAAHLAGGLACIWVASRVFAGGASAFLFGRRRIGRDVVYGIVMLFVSMATCWAVLEATRRLILQFDPDYNFFEHDVVDALRNNKAPIWALWIGTTVLTPIVEECFFRGMIQTSLMNVFRRKWVAVLLAAAVFGAVHAGGGESPQPHVVPALAVLGLLLGVLYARTGSLVGPIVLHALFNAKTLLWETVRAGLE
jgi:membrane protease YdiL (CAAX protease family)